MDNSPWILQNNEGFCFFEFNDDPYRLKFTVRQNKTHCKEQLSPTCLTQIHSSTIINIDHDDTRVGDGVISSDPRRVLGVKIADCLPVYLYNESTMCIIHCGWRGIIGGIARNARKLMNTYSYALGACIGSECFEVQCDVMELFRIDYPAAISNKNGRYFLDLKKAVIQDLGEASLVASLDLCTKCYPEYFYSYRRGDRENRNYATISRI